MLVGVSGLLFLGFPTTYFTSKRVTVYI
ncbi:hypothetical protein VCHENC02_2724A, partial [Vibrio harveyi]